MVVLCAQGQTDGGPGKGKTRRTRGLPVQTQDIIVSSRETSEETADLQETGHFLIDCFVGCMYRHTSPFFSFFFFSPEACVCS